MDNVQKEFSRNAKYYNEYNQIQREVVKDLLSGLSTHPSRVLDIGAGRGELYSQIEWPLSFFVAVDFSEAMCRLHPTGSNVRIMRGDFNRAETFRTLREESFDLICSASALQWAEDLPFVFGEIAAFKKPVALALFTSSTFAALHTALGIRSPLHTEENILKSAAAAFPGLSHSLRRYTLTFDSTKSMLEYIKKSGVSSGSKKLPVGELRTLIRQDSLRSIEAEVVFIYHGDKEA